MSKRRFDPSLIRYCLEVLMILVFAGMVKAQTVVSPFNQRALDPISGQYSFIVTGHLHGASTNASGFPASTLLANLDTINGSGAHFLISLGDMFLRIDEQAISNYDRSFFSKLEMPMFNAVGNHDVSGGLYSKKFGKRYMSFVYGSAMFIILDTEVDDGRIKDKQLDFFRDELAFAKKNSAVKNIFIFAHRPIWAENDPMYSKLFTDNTQTAIGSNNYETDVLPLVQDIAPTKPVYWFSGSMGGRAPASFFYDQTGNITYMTTAIRDLPRDAILLANINDDKVSFTGISLTGQQLRRVEEYGLSFWQQNTKMEEPFNYRLIPYLTLQMIKHHYFWIGFALASFFIVIISWFIVKRKRRNAAKAS